MFCDVADCPHNCTCTGDVFNCTGAGLIRLPQSSGVKVLDASNNKKILVEPSNFPKYNVIKVLILSNNDLTLLSARNESLFKHLKYLLYLYLDGNNISFLDQNSFSGLLHVRMIFLQRNSLKHVYHFTFRDCAHIVSLNLSKTGLESISAHAFKGLKSLKTLDLSDNMVESFSFESLNELDKLEWLNVTHILPSRKYFSNLQDGNQLPREMHYIGSDDWRICCLVTILKVCDVPKDEQSTCEDLLESQTLQMAVWITASTSFFANMYVLVYRVLLARNTLKTKANNIFLIHLAIADLLMSVYLLNIAVTDAKVRNKYVFFVHSWERGLQCKVLGMISCLSKEMSLSMKSMLSIVLLVGISGKGRDYLTPFVKHITCIILWTSLTLLSSVTYTGWIDVSSGLCVLFNFGKSVFSGWQYKVFLFLCLNSLFIIVMGLTCLKGIHIIYKSDKQVQKMGQVFGRKKNNSTYKNLVFLIGSALVTWIPVDVLLVISLCGVTFSPEVTSWFTIFVLPVTAISNPFLYTINNVIAQNRQSKPKSKRQIKKPCGNAQSLK